MRIFCSYWRLVCTRQTYLFQPYVVLVGQYVQSVLAFRLGFFNSLTCRVRVVTVFATTFQHAPCPLDFCPHSNHKFSKRIHSLAHSHTQKPHRRHTSYAPHNQIWVSLQSGTHLSTQLCDTALWWLVSARGQFSRPWSHQLQQQKRFPPKKD